MANLAFTTRDVARELARRYSTMTHDELDILESILRPMKFAKNEKILVEGETCENIYWVAKGLVRQFRQRIPGCVTLQTGHQLPGEDVPEVISIRQYIFA